MRTKILSLAIACIMLLGCATTAFAAETDNSFKADNTQFEIVEETPVVPAGANEIIIPLSQNDQADFKLGSVGYMSNCGFSPKFKCWVTGGSSSTQVKFSFKTGGGVSYGPFGPVKADGSNYLNKPFTVFNSNGVWQFTATVTSGENNGNLYCHVLQYY